METKIYLMISCSCLTMGTMILNDVFDVEEDKINNLDKPIANGSVGRVPAAISGTLCLIIAVLLSYLIDKKYSVCMLISSLICAFYSPLLKPFGILKNISTCFVTSLIVFALFRYVPKVTVYPKEIEKLIQTIEGDQNFNSQKSTENNQKIEACDTPETLDTEFPGIIGKAVGKFDSLSEFRYQTLKFNVDRLKIIQLGLTFSDSEGKLPEGTCTWQFNFKFNINVDIYAQDSIDLLTHSGIDFKKIITDGIDPNRFAELLISSGLVLNDSVYWVSFHSSYDFGYLIKLLTTRQLPMTKNQFFEWMWDFFPNIYDIKYLMLALGTLHGGLQSMANQLGVKRVGTQHQAGSDSLLTSAVYFSLRDVYFNKVVDNEFLGKLYGLSDDYSTNQIPFTPNNNLNY
ncbi:hypothetical protein M0813_15536 [Anaeramoeba flamelloides]|uniref:poly(A)-specific ribonuclease n=1 Tax=Anaeramoeba flamelloides TaxID=1746091 RepID=A0ABQ8Z1P5_9EUKA|nr:hypothetical protein M0813_15536 [Anaeramoeba flamelloides]